MKARLQGEILNLSVQLIYLHSVTKKYGILSNSVLTNSSGLQAKE